MSNPYPNLIETTMSGYGRTTYMLGLGATDSMLSEDEREVLEQSRQYVKEYERKENERKIKVMYEAFEELAKIENMPEDAMSIIGRFVDLGDEEEDWED